MVNIIERHYEEPFIRDAVLENCAKRDDIELFRDQMAFLDLVLDGGDMETNPTSGKINNNNTAVEQQNPLPTPLPNPAPLVPINNVPRALSINHVFSDLAPHLLYYLGNNPSSINIFKTFITTSMSRVVRALVDTSLEKDESTYQAKTDLQKAQSDRKLRQFTQILVQTPSFRQLLLDEAIQGKHTNFIRLMESALGPVHDLIDGVVQDFSQRFESFNCGNYFKNISLLETDHHGLSKLTSPTSQTQSLPSLTFIIKQIQSGLITIPAPFNLTKAQLQYQSINQLFSTLKAHPTNPTNPINPTPQRPFILRSTIVQNSAPIVNTTPLPFIFGSIVQNSQFTTALTAQLLALKQLVPINLNVKLILGEKDLNFQAANKPHLRHRAPLQSVTPIQFATMLDDWEIVFLGATEGPARGFQMMEQRCSLRRDVLVEIMIESYLQSIIDGDVDQIHPYEEFRLGD